MTASISALWQRSLLLTIGLLMAVILALGIAAMIGAIVVAQLNQGMAAAVNQSGTLRMQTYRIAAELTDPSRPSAERAARVRQLADELEARLTSPRLMQAIPSAATDPLRSAYREVSQQWQQRMRPALSAQAIATGGRAYRAQADAFVAQVHGLVRALEDRAERRIDWLAVMQAAALGLTLIAVLVTLLLLQRRLVRPLDALLRCADRVRQGDFSVRTRFLGEDELGRLGVAMNLMSEGVWTIYNALEARVSEKTRDLARSNQSLQLLYRASRTLDGATLSDPALRAVLVDVEQELKLASVTLCLRDGNSRDGTQARSARNEAPTGLCLSSRQSPDAAGGACALCRAAASASDGSLIAVPVADQDHRYGTLRVAYRDGAPLESWQQPLLEALAAQLATALNLQGRIRESRRLVLHEERSSLARELHDSLAQSLSYLKIQAVRLEAALNGQGAESAPAPVVILAELREGISSAYRQLRELLTTFRLKIGGEGLSAAVTETVDEFRLRTGLEIAVEDRLVAGDLSPNEEVHLLQIVREALSNAARHARAAHVRLRLLSDAASGEVGVEVSDDGVGLDTNPGRPGHYGLTIMRERAASLGGTLQIEPGVAAGTVVRLRFPPRSRRHDRLVADGQLAGHAAMKSRQ
ncbi:type IV pili methyl-accepting chemotaxis transducer N-terminal domain-containing protein [Halochromatium sp.]